MARHIRGRGTRHGRDRGARRAGSAMSQGQAPHLHVLADAGGDVPSGIIAPCICKLRIYTSWPMQGAMIPEGTGMKNGVDMAVAEASGVAAGYCLEVINLDDASPQTGKWDGAVEAENANKAVADPQAIVYIGTYNSGAAKVSIPINNR